MFNNLVASDGRKKKKTATAGTMVTSVVLHGLLVAGAVAASVVVPAVADKEAELVDYVEIVPEEPAPEPEAEPEPEPEPPPPEPEPAAAPPVIKGTQALVPPKEPPPSLPDVDLSAPAVKQEDFSGQGAIGGVAKGVDKGVKQNTAKREEPADEGVYEVSAVSEQPKLQNGPEVARQLVRQYPPLLRDAGVTGSATLEFVIGADGRVEPSSIAVQSATHDQFGDAARRVVEKMKFKAAKVNGQGVRVRVTLPVTFNLN